MLAVMESEVTLPMFDLETLGHRMRSARYLAGFHTPEAMNEALEKRFHMRYKRRTVLAVERGEQEPKAEMLLVLTMLYSPPGGLSFFAEAIPDEREREAFLNLCR